jgi:hypothetical protein
VCLFVTELKRAKTEGAEHGGKKTREGVKSSVFIWNWIKIKMAKPRVNKICIIFFFSPRTESRANMLLLNQ